MRVLRSVMKKESIDVVCTLVGKSYVALSTKVRAQEYSVCSSKLTQMVRFNLSSYAAKKP